MLLSRKFVSDYIELPEDLTIEKIADDMTSVGNEYDFAGKLIMDAGLRGYQVGGARVSDKHCGFVVNADNATAADVHQLMKDVIIKVQKEFQVTLEPEVIRLGEFK